ncbi:hypothetical protein CHS0354_005197 [Potamilus streckersoni]|uniref:Uncharacterized protein n=1 Tax=Potamilus streckersoni TaxID=2493646 RepID=A0AAE0RM24_9BIVA|nr:hypothetical protein CHS0354_005197 [Potamilus streckersoni]
MESLRFITSICDGETSGETEKIILVESMFNSTPAVRSSHQRAIFSRRNYFSHILDRHTIKDCCGR